MIYFIAILSFLFSSDIISDIHSYDLDESIDSEDTTYEEFPTLKYAFYSLLVPGSGQYGLSKIISQDDYKKKKSKQRIKQRALLFLSLDIVSWGANFYNKNRYSNQVSSYREYADDNWSFADWIHDYNDFLGTDYSYLWENNNGEQDIWMGIGESSHYVQFYYGESRQIIRTTDTYFKEELLNDLIEALDTPDGDIYTGEYSVEVIKDQHFYENIGKYNEFFTGWVDGDINHISVSVTDHGYQTPRSPIKNFYLNEYNKAEKFSDYAERALWCIYFNHFISMVDAFILTHRFNGDVMLHSSTVFDQKKIGEPIGVKLNLSINI